MNSSPVRIRRTCWVALLLAASHLAALASPALPLAMAELADVPWDGRDFRLERRLEVNAAYETWAFAYLSDGLRVSGWAYLPTGPGPFPVAVMGHGYFPPEVYRSGTGSRRESPLLASNKIAAFHTDYRGYAGSDADPNMAADFRHGYARDAGNLLAALARWADPRIDASRALYWGHSMGGGVGWKLNALAAPFRAMVLFAPVSAWEADNFERWVRPNLARLARASRVGLPETHPEVFEAASAAALFERMDTPTLVLHGTADESVPLAWSERACARLKALAKPVSCVTYHGEPHQFTGGVWGDVSRRMLDFIRRHL